MLLCVQCSYKSPERQLFFMEVSTCFYIYTKTSHHSFSILTDGTPYFVGIVWIADDMNSLFIRESSVGSLLNIFYPLTRWGIFDQIWPNSGAPQWWGFWPKFFWKATAPHMPGALPLGLNMDSCIIIEWSYWFIHTYISLFSNNYFNKFDMPTGS